MTLEQLPQPKKEYSNRPSIDTKYCVDCHCVLTTENTLPSNRRQYKNICKQCRTKRNKQYHLKNRIEPTRVFTNPKGCTIKRCYKCKVELDPKNTHPSFLRINKYICKKCAKEQIKKWETKHPNYRLNWNRNYVVIGKNGRYLTKTKKRQRTNFCEMCKCTNKKLSYHHWDDNHPEQGYWVCSRCHQIVEFIDQNGVEHLHHCSLNYVSIKNKLIYGELS